MVCTYHYMTSEPVTRYRCFAVLCIHTADKADPMSWSTIPLGEEEAAAEKNIDHPV